MYGLSGLAGVKILFFDFFKGALALFLLEMGVLTAGKISALKKYGFFIVAFGIIMPIFSAFLGGGLGFILDLTPGGITLLSILSASASYIAVPAAMRVSVPSANLSLSLSASLGVTFPFNVIVGIPLYYQLVTFFMDKS